MEHQKSFWFNNSGSEYTDFNNLNKQLKYLPDRIVTTYAVLECFG